MPSDEMVNDSGMVMAAGTDTGTLAPIVAVVTAVDEAAGMTALDVVGELSSISMSATVELGEVTSVTAATGTADAMVATSSISESMPCAKSI